MRIIAIINQKGGCGKTTTAINLAAVLASAGRRTLLVDLDPQSHCAAGLAVPPSRIDIDIGDAMLSLPGKGFDPDRLLWRVTRNLDLAPSRTKLAGLEATRGGLAGAPERERRLSGVLEHVRTKGGGDPFEFCVLDCPPSIGLLTYNAITAAGEIIIPVETSFFSLQGATRQVATIRSLGRRLGTRPVTRLLATMHDASHGLARDLRSELVRRFDKAMIPVTIRLDPSLRESASFGQPIVEYDPTSTGAADYKALGAWVIENGESGAAPDAAMIEVKQTTVPLGSRRRAGDRHRTEGPGGPDVARERGEDRPKAGPVRRGEALAKPLRAARESVEQAAPRGPETERVVERTGSEALETMSRIEDLCRRAQALQERTNATPEPVTTRLRSSTGTVQLIERLHDKTRREKTVARLFGVRHTGGRLLFVQPIELGVDVRIAGDFNGWNPVATPMRRNETLGVHELTIDAPPPGRHAYRLVVDGRWIEDQFNPMTEPNEFGDRNSIVIV